MVDEEHGGEDEAEADDVIPLDSLTQIEHGEEAEDDESDAFLHDLELGGGLAGKVADAVGGDLEAVFEGGDAPTDEDDFPKGDLCETQVAVPCESHEDVADGEKDCCFHGCFVWGWE